MLHRYLDVFKSFQKHKVKYVVIGGMAAIAHGVPRNTFDLDILIEPTLENAERLLRALLEARVGTAMLTTPERLLSHEITVFKERYSIDVQTRTPGLRFSTAWKNREVVTFRDQPIVFAARRDLIRSKRRVDIEDVEALLAAPDDSEDRGDISTN